MLTSTWFPVPLPTSDVTPSWLRKIINVLPTFCSSAGISTASGTAAAVAVIFPILTPFALATNEISKNLPTV